MNLQSNKLQRAPYVAPCFEVFSLRSVNLLKEASLHEGVFFGEFEEKDEW